MIEPDNVVQAAGLRGNVIQSGISMSQHDKSQVQRSERDQAAETTPQPDIEPVQTEDEETVDAGADPTASTADSVSETDELKQALDQAQAEAEQYRDQAVRAYAEMENVRKRAQRDVDAARKFALEKFATELLGVRDSLELGLKAADEQSGDFDKLKEGMDMTARMLASSMEKVGIEVIDPMGEAFDPEFHEAVSTQPTDEQASNTVSVVMQKGYMLNGRVLRAAMVVVAKPTGERKG